MSPLRPLSLPRLSIGGGSPSAAPAGDQEAAFPVFDLLREPRQELGQQPIAPVLNDRRRLLLQGTAIGAALLGTVFGIMALVFLRHQVVKAQMGGLSEVEGQAAGLRQELASRSKRIATITEVNRQLSSALSNVRPTSAVMSELQLRTPDGIQLLSADAGNANLSIKGLANDPLAFARINALQLELRRSPLLDPLGVNLSRLERQTEERGKGNLQAPVQFELSARFTKLDAGKLAEVLEQLGSDGMARRLRLLQREGLLP